MATIAVDAGHGGADRGGRSLGTPESVLVLGHALQLAVDLEALGHRVLLTRATDVFVPLAERARLANQAGAELFVSLHANASENSNVWGPWTIHSAGSARGREIAHAMQRALVAVVGGHEGAVYPDASGWVGNRRLTVLRRTRMPAVLVELGFMTHPRDLAQMEDDSVRARVSAALAAAVDAELGGAAPPAPRLRIAESPTVHPADDDRLALEPIPVPSREHLARAAAAAGVEPAQLRGALPAVELLLRGMEAAGGARGASAAELRSVLEEYRSGG